MFLSVADLSVVHSIEMPAPMHFREEGGASLSPNGTKILAVSTGSDFCRIIVGPYRSNSGRIGPVVERI
jgi:hypothetical protein